MKKFLNKCVVVGTLLFGFSSLGADTGSLSYSTNVATASRNILLATPANVKQVSVTAGDTSAVRVELFDNADLVNGGTNYVYPAYTSVTRYATNIITEFISPMTGYTNSYTNSYIFTDNVANSAATNALTASFVVDVPINGETTLDVDLVHTRGVVMRSSTNASVIIRYNPNN